MSGFPAALFVRIMHGISLLLAGMRSITIKCIAYNRDRIE